MGQSISWVCGVGEEPALLSRRHIAVGGVHSHFRLVSGLPTGDVRSTESCELIKACL